MIPLHHAQQDLSVMIWYVQLPGNRGEAAHALRLLCPACSYMSPRSHADALFCGIVSLASNNNGTCTLSLIAATAACFGDITLFFVRGHRVRVGSCMLTHMHRVTAHTREAFSSSLFTSRPITLSNLRRSTSQPVSTTPTSTQTAAYVWTSCVISGALL